MTPEEWRQIEEVLAAAMELPEAERGAFLAETCAGRPEIRAEVEAMLAVRSRADAAFAVAPAVAVAGAAMSVSVGSRLGPYEILSPLGAGGMGEVFKARDSRLGRLVAIKVLPAYRTADPERKRRFLQEARAASALNHPGIVALHDIGNEGGLDYLVMEYVPGCSLRETLSRKKLKAGEALGYGAEIAAALAAAHAAGIVHRDIKPANLIVTTDSHVKILDFGLAKLVDSAPLQGVETGTTETAFTGAGAVMGTVGYMSPEQASGREVDHRTDIFALGIVLYEMVAGKRPFQAKSPVETLNAIINEATPPLPSPSDVLEEILAKALAKDPNERYQHAGDLGIDLHRLQRVSKPGASRSEPGGPWIRLAAVVIGGVLLTVAGAAAGWWIHERSSAVADPLEGAQFSKLTDFPGTKLGAAISPDGGFVAFLSDREGPFDVFSAQVGSGRFLNLTHGVERNLGPLLERPVTFSKGGSEICFHDADASTSMKVIPLLGGPSRAFLGRLSQQVAWSSDGSRLAYHTSDPGDPIFVADPNGANPRQIFGGPPGLHNHYLSWSLDGAWIYFVSGVAAANQMDLWRIRPSGATPERLTRLNSNVSYPAQIDSRTLLYIAPDSKGAGPWLWSLDLDRRATRRAGIGLEKYTSLEASANGRRLAVTIANPEASLWSVPILDRIAEERDVKPFPTPTVRALMPRFGGSALFYLSATDAGDGLWRYQDGQTLEIWKGADGALLEPPAVSANGRQVAFVLRRNGKLRLQMEMSDGTELQAIAPDLDVQGAASWSPDGKWIVTGGTDAKGAGLFKIPVAGGAPVRVVSGLALNPVWSPDGALIAYAAANVGGFGPVRAVRPDGTAAELPEIQVQRDGVRIRFLPNGRGLVCAQGVSSSSQDFWLVDLAARTSRRLTRLGNSAAMRAFDVTPDGKQIVFDRSRDNSQVAVIDLPKAGR